MLAPEGSEIEGHGKYRVIKYEGKTKPFLSLAKQGTFFSNGQPGAIESFDDRRLAPLHPSEFAKLAATKSLTNGKDLDVLVKLQAKVAAVVLGNVRDLRFPQLGWGNEDAAMLAKALGMCSQLQTLNLSNNKIGPAGAESLAAALAMHPTLAKL